MIAMRNVYWGNSGFYLKETISNALKAQTCKNFQRGLSTRRILQMRIHERFHANRPMIDPAIQE